MLAFLYVTTFGRGGERDKNLNEVSIPQIFLVPADHFSGVVRVRRTLDSDDGRRRVRTMVYDSVWDEWEQSGCGVELGCGNRDG